MKDMTHLRIIAVDRRNSKALGCVYVDFLQYLNPSVTMNDFNIFQDFSKVFKIYKMPSVTNPNPFQCEIGEIELSFFNSFQIEGQIMPIKLGS